MAAVENIVPTKKLIQNSTSEIFLLIKIQWYGTKFFKLDILGGLQLISNHRNRFEGADIAICYNFSVKHTSEVNVRCYTASQ